MDVHLNVEKLYLKMFYKCLLFLILKTSSICVTGIWISGNIARTYVRTLAYKIIF